MPNTIYSETILPPTTAEATQQCLGENKPVTVADCVKKKTAQPTQVRNYTLETVTPQQACSSYIGKEKGICLTQITKPFRRKVYQQQPPIPVLTDASKYTQCLLSAYGKIPQNRPSQCGNYRPN